MTVRNTTDALRLLEKRGVYTLADLVVAVAGHKPAGSWWGHPKGKLIYAISTELEDHPDVLACKLPRATFVHRTLWPPLLRVVTDASWRKRRLGSLTPAITRVVRRISRTKVRLDTKTLAPKEKAVLEKSCLVLVTSEHTETGAHATVLRSWTAWAPATVKSAAAKLTFDGALNQLSAAGLHL
jgi:hypothetical protein